MRFFSSAAHPTPRDRVTNRTNAPKHTLSLGTCPSPGLTLVARQDSTILAGAIHLTYPRLWARFTANVTVQAPVGSRGRAVCAAAGQLASPARFQPAGWHHDMSKYCHWQCKAQMQACGHALQRCTVLLPSTRVPGGARSCSPLLHPRSTAQGSFIKLGWQRR